MDSHATAEMQSTFKQACAGKGTKGPSPCVWICQWKSSALRCGELMHRAWLLAWWGTGRMLGRRNEDTFRVLAHLLRHSLAVWSSLDQRPWPLDSRTAGLIEGSGRPAGPLQLLTKTGKRQTLQIWGPEVSQRHRWVVTRSSLRCVRKFCGKMRRFT